VASGPDPSFPPGGGGATAATSTTGGASGTGAGGSAKSVTGTSAPTSGSAAGCPGQALQVPSDPYSPPCIQFSGNNGGATSLGVTSSTITLSFRVNADFESLEQSFGNLSAAAPTTSVADLERTYQGMVTYFNDHFQFYGR
jgi:hypothetical protein